MTSFSVPFAINSAGQVATVTDPDTTAMLRVRALISTSPGSRVMLPDYGINLPSYLFSPDIPGSSDRLSNDIETALQTWEPSIKVIQIIPIVNNESTGFVDVNVEFTTSNDQSFTPTLIATVLIGGTVVGN